ncbi:MAG: hypothetical protein H5T84_08200 [Thermoleophilia bacterium]|nr:hypothetical protein [Thermoleophilia bacterium]
MVRRLSSLVLEDLKNHEELPLTNVFWAAVYAVHWARHQYDLHLVEFLLRRQAGLNTTLRSQQVDKALPQLPLE